MLHFARAAMMTMPLALGACQGAAAPASMSANSIGQETQQVGIAYSIAHGMATSYATSGRATEVTLLTLLRYDQAAYLAMRGAGADPSRQSLATAVASIRALMDYTTIVDTRPNGPLNDQAAFR